MTSNKEMYLEQKTSLNSKKTRRLYSQPLIYSIEGQQLDLHFSCHEGQNVYNKSKKVEIEKQKTS
jgi:hypothetical protein